MSKKHFSVFLLVTMFIFVGSRMAQADDANLDDATKARIAKFEQGPSTIDVSKYPQKIQDIYTDIFSQKCMQCHRLSRPINSDFALPSEWESYVKLMMHKPGSNINNGDARKIIDFLIYDSSVRKKDLMDEKLKKISDFLIYDSSVRKKALIGEKLLKVTPEEKVVQETKIKEIQDKYNH